MEQEQRLNVLVLGEAGVGKSTLIRAISGTRPVIGRGQSTTRKIDIYVSDTWPLRLIDARGFEYGFARQRRKARKQMRQFSKEQVKNQKKLAEQPPVKQAGTTMPVTRPEDEILAGTNPNKIAYLTFDDGPYERTTGRYLDVLKDRNVLATFFQLGRPSEKLDALYHRAYDEGHTIANHTYSHQIRNGIYRGVSYFINDVIKNREFIQDKLGYTTNILRFPGGSSTARSLKPAIIEELRELGYGWVDWNAATGDGIEIMSPQEYRDNVLKKTGGRSVLVVLMHDYSENTLTALPEIIDGLRAQGYTLLPLFYESAMINK